MWANGACGSREKLHGVLRRDHVFTAESLMEKRDAYVDSDLFIKLYEIARFSQSQLREDKMWPTAKCISHRAGRYTVVYVCIRMYTYIKPVLFSK